MTLQEAKARYETNGGHYFEWFDFFGQELDDFYNEKHRTFIVICRNRYSVLGFTNDFCNTLGYGNRGGYAKREEAVKIANRPGKPKW